MHQPWRKDFATSLSARHFEVGTFGENQPQAKNGGWLTEWFYSLYSHPYTWSLMCIMYMRRNFNSIYHMEANDYIRTWWCRSDPKELLFLFLCYHCSSPRLPSGFRSICGDRSIPGKVMQTEEEAGPLRNSGRKTLKGRPWNVVQCSKSNLVNTILSIIGAINDTLCNTLLCRRECS